MRDPHKNDFWMNRQDLIEKYGDGLDAEMSDEDKIDNEIERILFTDRDLDAIGEAVDPSNHVRSNTLKGITWTRAYEEYLVTLRVLIAKEDWCELGRMIGENAIANIHKVAKDRVDFDEV